MATIHTFVADIVDRIPAMAKDSPDNNRMLLENLTREFLENAKKESHNLAVNDAAKLVRSQIELDFCGAGSVNKFDVADRILNLIKP
jgi:hypothetical protein